MCYCIMPINIHLGKGRYVIQHRRHVLPHLQKQKRGGSIHSIVTPKQSYGGAVNHPIGLAKPRAVISKIRKPLKMLS